MNLLGLHSARVVCGLLPDSLAGGSGFFFGIAVPFAHYCTDINIFSKRKGLQSSIYVRTVFAWTINEEEDARRNRAR